MTVEKLWFVSASWGGPWSALADALRSPSVGLSHLAQEILEQN